MTASLSSRAMTLPDPASFNQELFPSSHCLVFMGKNSKMSVPSSSDWADDFTSASELLFFGHYTEVWIDPHSVPVMDLLSFIYFIDEMEKSGFETSITDIFVCSDDNLVQEFLEESLPSRFRVNYF